MVEEIDQADKVLDFNRKSQDSLPPQLNDLIHRDRLMVISARPFIMRSAGWGIGDGHLFGSKV